MRKKYPKYVALFDEECCKEVRKIPSKTKYYVLRQMPQEPLLPIGFVLKDNYISWYSKRGLYSHGTLECEIYDWNDYKEIKKEEFALVL